MAGNYDDVPGPRIAYDRDGSVLYTKDTEGTITVRTREEAESVQDVAAATGIVGGTGSNQDFFYGVIFPQPMDIVGYYIRLADVAISDVVATSPNTTNGVDGDWTSHGAFVRDEAIDPSTRPRTFIQEVDFQGIVGIRFRITRSLGSGGGTPHSLRTLHLYGAPSTPPTSRLAAWHPTNDEELDLAALFDFADVVGGMGPYTKSFRVKNTSDAFIAEGVSVTHNILTDIVPSLADQIDYESASNPGVWADSLDLGNLSPGQISPVLTVRYTPPADARLGLWETRTLIEAESWSGT